MMDKGLEIHKKLTRDLDLIHIEQEISPIVAGTFISSNISDIERLGVEVMNET